MNIGIRIRTLAMVLVALVLALASAQALARGGHGGHSWHGHHHHHCCHGAIWGFGLGLVYYPAGPWYRGDHADEAPAGMSEPGGTSAPNPVIYPRYGQSAAQTEADRQDCNRWATTQPGAMADAGEFERTALACMEGRGYSIR